MIKQPLLSDLKYFVTAVANLNSNKKEVSLKLVKCSLNLITNFPCARELIFDYFSVVFDIIVNNYIVYTKKDSPTEEEAIKYIQDALENLITQDFNSINISTWSLKLLGKLSDKSNSRIPTNITDASKFWLGSNSMRCLLGLTALCFRKLNDNEIDDCISTLLGIFFQYSPHFDWVVARLGSCFPLKIISKLLQCGLGRFSESNNSLDCEIKVLENLAYSHDKDLKFAIKELLLSALILKNDIKSGNPNLIPYLLHLSRMSNGLLQPIVNVFLELFDESLIPTLSFQSTFWPKQFNDNELLLILTDLITKVTNDSTKIMIKLGSIAVKYPWCQELLEYIFGELEYFYLQEIPCSLLQNIVNNESKTMLWKSCCSDNSIEHQTAVRLILLVSNTKYSLIFHQTISELLTTESNINYNGIASLVRILNGPGGTLEIPDIKPGIELALEKFFLCDKRKQQDNDIINLNILRNLVYILRLEKKKNCANLKRKLLSKACEECEKKFLCMFENLMERVTKNFESANTFTIIDNTQQKYQEQSTSNENITDNVDDADVKIKIEHDDGDDDDVDDDNHKKKLKIENRNIAEKIKNNLILVKEQIHVLVKLFDILEVGRKEILLDVADVLKMTHLIVKYFFWNLTEKNPIIRLTAMNNTYSILSRLRKRRTARTTALKDLLEGALFNYGNFFGGETEDYSIDTNKGEELLIILNQKLGVVSNTNRSILHAGVIGKGIRAKSKEAKLPETEVQNMLLKAITSCCKDEMPGITVDGFCSVSLLLVEMVSPDVMYNGLPWPEEDFSKVTMERDLQIRRTFKNSPILWSILELVATHRPALCYASVLFRALCASVLHQWQAKSVEKTINLINSDLMFVTVKLLEIMSLGQFIPPPLSYFHCVIEHFEPNEIAVVLKDCIWMYMKENIPSPILFAADRKGFQMREPCPRTQNYFNILRNMMERKLPQLGHYYHMMFVLPEAYDEIIDEEAKIILEHKIVLP